MVSAGVCSQAMRVAGAKVLSLDAGRTLIFDRDAFFKAVEKWFNDVKPGEPLPPPMASKARPTHSMTPRNVFMTGLSQWCLYTPTLRMSFHAVDRFAQSMPFGYSIGGYSRYTVVWMVAVRADVLPSSPPEPTVTSGAPNNAGSRTA